MTNHLQDVSDEFLRSLDLRAGKGTGKEGDRCSIQVYRAYHGLDPKYGTIPDGASKVVGAFIIGFQDRIKHAGATREQMFDLVTRRYWRTFAGSYGARTSSGAAPIRSST